MKVKHGNTAVNKYKYIVMPKIRKLLKNRGTGKVEHSG